MSKANAMQSMHRRGPSLGSQVRSIEAVMVLDAQISRLKEELAATYQPEKLSSINPVDLAAERRDTKRSIERLTKHKEAIIAAHKQNVARAWTERGDFTCLMASGVYIRCAFNR